MKKLILFIILLVGLYPNLDKGILIIESGTKAYAEVYLDEYGDDEDDDCPPGTWMNGCGDCWDEPGICEIVDPCDQDPFSCDCSEYAYGNPECGPQEPEEPENPEDPCNEDPNDCGCPDYAANNLEECSGASEPDDPDAPKDPCDEASKLSDMVNNSMQSTFNDIKNNTSSSGNEYGTEVKKSAPNDAAGYLPISAPRTDGQPNSFTPAFTWDATNGYTLGLPHGHPSGMPPSVADIFKIPANFNTKVNQSGTGIDYYKENAWVAAITDDGVFIVTVNDWDDLMALGNTYAQDPGDFESNYAAKINDYYSATGDVNQVNAQQYALLETFGNSINLYKAPANSSNYEPMEKKSSYGTGAKPCP